MNRKTLGRLVLADVVVLLVWLAIMIAMGATAGMPATFAESLDFVRERHWLFYDVSYANAVALTLLGVAVMGGLYAWLKDELGGWGQVAFAFVPVYGLVALVSYLSQLVVVPDLVASLGTGAAGSGATGAGALASANAAGAELALRHLIQIWPESSLAYFDQFSYFLLGIPSFVFGLALARHRGAERVAGWLLVAGGPFSLAIGVGVVAGWAGVVGVASMTAGVLSIAAFVALAIGLLGPEPTTRSEAASARPSAQPA